MPNNSSHADVVTDVEELLTNVRNATDLPDLTVYRAPVEQFLEEIKSRGALRKTRLGVKQEETRALKDLMFEGREKVASLRAAIKAHLGIRNPRLVEFGMKPVRQRFRKGGTVEGPQGPAAPAANPETR